MKRFLAIAAASLLSLSAFAGPSAPAEGPTVVLKKPGLADPCRINLRANGNQNFQTQQDAQNQCDLVNSALNAQQACTVRRVGNQFQARVAFNAVQTGLVFADIINQIANDLAAGGVLGLLQNLQLTQQVLQQNVQC